MLTRILAAAAILLLAGAPALGDEIDEEVQNQFHIATADVCFSPNAVAPEVYTVTVPDSAGGPDRSVRLYKLFCFSGAYTAVHVWYMQSDLTGVQRLAFAQPAYEVECPGTAGAVECPEAMVRMTGYAAVTELPNSTFDPATLMLTSMSCWRGPCDAFEGGHWQFTAAGFVLRYYEVDAAYDGVQLARPLIDFAGGP